MRTFWDSLPAIEAALSAALPFALLALVLVPGLVALWAAARRRTRRRALWRRQRSLATLRAMTWQEFEQLTGETFRALGYRIEETGQGGADGGLDLLITKGGQRYAVQCKHYARQKVGAPVVRDAVGAAVHVRARAVFVVALAGFTSAARAYAAGKPVHLLDGAMLLEMIDKGRQGQARAAAPAASVAGHRPTFTP